MISNHKKSFTGVIHALSKPFLGVHPNILTLLSLFFSLLFFLSLVYHNYILSLLSFVGFVFDAIDGYVARATGKESAFGAFLDSTLDRVSDFLLIAAFGYAGLVRWEIVIPTLATTFLVSYARARAELAAKGVLVLSEGLVQRAERTAGIFVLLVLFLLFPNVTFASLPILELGFILLTLLNTYVFLERILSAKEKLT